jgi:hypothetical protein
MTLLTRARRLWTHLAGAPVGFRAAGFDVAVAPQSALCPPGWVGIVTLGAAAIVTAPDPRTASLVRRAVSDLSCAALTAPAALTARLPVDRTLGPATLAYCTTATFRPCPSPAGAVETLPAGHPDIAALLAKVSAPDAAEADLTDLVSPAFAIRHGGTVVAAAGYHTWPLDTAHLSVLTAPAARGRGLAHTAASAAVAGALAADLLPQWRAGPAASRRVARALGFTELGAQLSIRLTLP